MANKPVFVAIAGNIGSGKTTLTSLLSKAIGWRAHFEVVAENPYLRDFYEDMNRWSFPLQIFFLNNRFKVHRSIVTGSESSIQDRSIYEDANIFARNLYETGKMEHRDYHNYLEIYRSMCDFLDPPDLVVYLKKSVPNLKSRISTRGRDFEKNIPDQYLTDLNRYYDEWMGEYNLGNKLILEVDDRDFLNSSEDFGWLYQKIVGSIEQRDIFFETPGLVIQNHLKLAHTIPRQIN